jgi:hypothetical protein
VQHTRYQLIHGLLLRRLMRCPDTGGTRHTVRSLAEASGVSKSKIGYMMRGRQMRVTASQARAIAEAVGLPREALFTPTTSTFTNATTESV